MYSIDDGELAVRLARSRLEMALLGKESPNVEIPDIFKAKSGVFVTLNTHPKGELRGCIGFPEPVMPLIQALEDAVISAATRDPRFPPVKSEELDHITVEVSLLTPPMLIKVKKPKEYPKHIVVGRDGLIIERGMRRGLLLPQVATENKWNSKTFLENLCWKAGLAPATWLEPLVKIYRFEGEVFHETSPGGPVLPKRLA